jgi:hypothetical protein
VGRGGGARHGGGACPWSFARGRTEGGHPEPGREHGPLPRGAAAAPSPSPSRAAAPASAYEDARSALKALALPPKKYAYFVRRAEEAIEAGKGWSPIVARARRVAEKLGGPVKPAQKPPTRQPKPQAPTRPPAVDTAIDSFNREAGWRAEKLRARANGYVLAIYPEGRDADAAVASVDVILGDVDETRWLDERLTPAGPRPHPRAPRSRAVGCPPTTTTMTTTTRSNHRRRSRT